MRKFIVFVLMLLFLFAVNSDPTLAATEKRCGKFPEQNITLSDFQKEAISSIKTIAERLILVAIGVFSFIGSYLVKIERPLKSRWSLIVSLGFFLFSALSGILTIGEIITQLSCNYFNSYHESLVLYGFAQQFTILLGGGFFLFFVYKNLGCMDLKER